MSTQYANDDVVVTGLGATTPLEANTGSIRGDYAIAVGQNMVHGSDAPESAAREVALFFPSLG